MVRVFCLWIIGFLLIGVSAVGAANFADPMRPARFQSAPSTLKPSVKQETPDSWLFSAVLISMERSVAIINGEPRQTGDVVKGYRLVEIRPEQVTFKKQGKIFNLRRTGTGLKKTPVQQ